MKFNLSFFIFAFVLKILAAEKSNDIGPCYKISTSDLCVRIDKKYYIIDGKAELNWFEAERLCRRQNAFLATIENSKEMSSISKYLFSKNYDLGDNWFWTSGNDLESEGTFYSVGSGQILPFTDWMTGQPDNAGGNENCVHLRKKMGGFGMNDVNCDRKIHYICEFEERFKEDELIFDVRTDWIKTRT